MKESKKSLRKSIVSVINGLQALSKRNGKGDNPYVSLVTIYKVKKADTVIKRAAIRGVLNHDVINGGKTFERGPIPDGKKRSGIYRLKINEKYLNEVV
jgi:hypothetical protein